jgi:hypothetical protein
MYRALMILAAAEGVGFGLGNLLAPDLVLSVVGGETEPLGRATLQQMGGVIIGYGVVAWCVRDMEPGSVRRGIIAGIVISFTFSGLMATIATASGLVNALGWAIVLVHAVVAVGLAWVLISDMAFGDHARGRGRT